jgi:hypothetical protein
MLCAAALILGTGALLVACGGGDDKTVNVPGGGEVSVGDDIPDGFPDDFPRYPGADEKGGYRGEQDGVEGFVAIWETDDSVEDVQAFFEEELAKDPWSTSGSISSSGFNIISFENSSAGTAGGVTVGEEDGKTTISVFLGEDGTGGGSSDDGEEPTEDDGSSSGDGEEPTEDDGSGSSGSSDLPDEVDLDEDYPSDLALPDGARVTDSSKISSGGTTTIFVQAYSEDSVDELEEYFKDKLTAAGWTEAITSSSGGDVFLTYSKGENSTDGVYISITSDSGYEGYRGISVSITSTEG